MTGDGPPVVLVHGFEGDQRSYDAMIPYLEPTWSVVTYDQREKGDTSFGDLPYSMDDLADDLAALLDALGIPRAHVVGTSFGGMVVQAFALRHPSRLDHLVIAASARCGTDTSKLPPDIQAIIAAMTQGDPDASAELRRRYYDARSLVRDPGLIDHSAGARLAPEQIARRRGAGEGFDSRGQLARVDAPALVIHGRADPVTLAEESLAMTLELPRGSMLLLDGVGHMWQQELPALAATHLSTFFATSSEGGLATT